MTSHATGFGAGPIDASGTATCDKSYVHAGTHQLDASFSGTASQAVRPATLVQSVDQGTQTITFASRPPSNATLGGSYTPTATSTSGRQVTITIDAGSASVSAIDGAGTVSFTVAGTCVIDAGQAGDSDYLSAAQVQQPVTVAAPAPPPSGGGGGGSGQPGSGLPGPVTGQYSATSTDPAGTAVAKQGCATATASGAETVTLATYGSDPVDPADFRASDAYFDLRTDSGSTFSQLVLTCQAAGTTGN